MTKEEEQKWQDLLAARAKMTAAPVVFASDPVAQGYRAIPLDDTEVETPVVQSPGVQKPSTDPSTWGVVDMTTVKPQETKTAPAYELPPRPEKPAGYGDYGWFDNFSNDYFEPPLTPEERARRERVAYISSGVANLGSAIGALGNMFLASKGAPAQKLSTVPDVDQKVSAFRQHADKVRDDYLRSRMAAQKAQDDLYDKEDARWWRAYNNSLTDAYHKEQLRIRQEEVDRRKAKDLLLAQAQEAEIEGKKELANLRRMQAWRIEMMAPAEVQRVLAQAFSATASGNKSVYQTGPRTSVTTDNGDGTKTTVTAYDGVVTPAPARKKQLPSTSASQGTVKKKLPNT